MSEKKTKNRFTHDRDILVVIREKDETGETREILKEYLDLTRALEEAE